MFNQTIALYIDDTSMRLLVSQGTRLKKWAEAKLDPGMVKGSVVQREADVSDRLKMLLETQHISGRKVSLGFSGLHSLTRPVVLPDLPRAMIPEAVAREARRVLPVPLDQLYLSWKLVPSPKGRLQAFMVANPRKAIDSMIKVLNKAGLEPNYMTVKPLALTKVVAETTAIIVDLQNSEYDIVVMSEGIPQPIRTIPLPEIELTLPQKAEMISSDLDRTIKFFDSNNPEKALASTVPIYVAGELHGKPELYKILEDTINHPVKALTTSLKGSEDIDLGRFMINVGMITKSPAPGRESTFHVSTLNVLPAPYQPKPISAAKLIAIPGAAAVAAIVVPLIMLMQNASANIEGLQKELDRTNTTTNQRMAEQRELQTNVTELEGLVAAAGETVSNLKASVDFLAVSHEIVNGDLNIAIWAAPPMVTITGITEDGSTLEIKGSSPDEAKVLDYARALKLSGRFAETTISSLKQTGISSAQDLEGQTPEEGTPEEGTTWESPEEFSLEFTLTLKR